MPPINLEAIINSYDFTNLATMLNIAADITNMFVKISAFFL
jgi:hypothetical protein